MLIIPVKEGENIDRALKRFKRKFLQTQVLKEIRQRKEFTKKSDSKIWFLDAELDCIKNTKAVKLFIKRFNVKDGSWTNTHKPKIFAAIICLSRCIREVIFFAARFCAACMQRTSFSWV